MKRNEDNNETILVMDGMVYDVTRWLPEHPGGNTIIPKQALGKDSTKFFELYHSSRKSFMYLKEFYIGEIHPNDLKDIPPASKRRSLYWISGTIERVYDVANQGKTGRPRA